MMVRFTIWKRWPEDARWGHGGALALKRAVLGKVYWYPGSNSKWLRVSLFDAAGSLVSRRTGCGDRLSVVTALSSSSRGVDRLAATTVVFVVWSVVSWSSILVIIVEEMVKD